MTISQFNCPVKIDLLFIQPVIACPSAPTIPTVSVKFWLCPKIVSVKFWLCPQKNILILEAMASSRSLSTLYYLLASCHPRFLKHKTGHAAGAGGTGVAVGA